MTLFNSTARSSIYICSLLAFMAGLGLNSVTIGGLLSGDPVRDAANAERSECVPAEAMHAEQGVLPHLSLPGDDALSLAPSQEQPDNAEATQRSAGANAGRSIGERLNDLSAMLSQTAAGNEQKLSDELAELTSQVASNDDMRQAVLGRFLATVGTDEGSALASVLGATRDADVETAMLTLVQTASTQAQRLSALDALTQVQSLSTSTRKSLIDLLTQTSSTDAEVTVASLAALGKRGVATVQDREAVVNAVGPLLQSTDPKVRDEALRVYAEWAPQDEGTVKQLYSASQDPDVNVRMNALLLLGKNGFKFDDVRDILVTRLQDPREEFQVRFAAWQALESFALDEHTLSLYAEFEQQHASEVKQWTN